jgi:hypothetical protein
VSCAVNLGPKLVGPLPAPALILLITHSCSPSRKSRCRETSGILREVLGLLSTSSARVRKPDFIMVIGPFGQTQYLGVCFLDLVWL